MDIIFRLMAIFFLIIASMTLGALIQVYGTGAIDTTKTHSVLSTMFFGATLAVIFGFSIYGLIFMRSASEQEARDAGGEDKSADNQD